MASGSGGTIRGYGSLIGGRGGSDIGGGIRLSSGTGYSADSGSVAMSSADTSCSQCLRHDVSL